MTEHIYTVVTYRGDHRTEHLVRSSEPPERVEHIVENVLHGHVYCYAPSAHTTLRHHPVELPLTLEQLVRGWWSPNLWSYRSLKATGDCLPVFTECMNEELDRLRKCADAQKTYLSTSIEEIEGELGGA